MMNLDALIEEAVDGRPCSGVTHDALWMLVNEWKYRYFRWETIEQNDALNEMLAGDIADVLAGGVSQFGDEWIDRIWQAMAYTKPDGGAFFDSSYDDV